ncbi:2Fe-2S iron-sulfur cluster binding domain-containing protein [Blastococcus sp. TML/M2B]|uniref:2Fe-2S iron-sulfur cluster-binding protein n=1 Tax=unclassified Blastococcus TaxID=2619396 RepID=UPI00190DE56B|nr:MULTISPECIES: 2Fe-2S iron-sulfur cluster-binding protein [unclassified Blastococcus]MBN1091786.1 2Fe-2S iron-sulfur cluster binding domain-containing protein [Blastococcus sp. TML/M2B]MBN1094655.1 2Fe-2S iron-sulfur cluster binding domain-containing protein [Blastococcus sp. TML/C7B]
MNVTFTLQDRTSRTVEAEPGWKLMEVAVDNAIPGIDGDCGGEAACATCHVYVASEWRDATGERTDLEQAMLASTFGVRENSRLSCQIETSEELDGLSVEVVGS